MFFFNFFFNSDGPYSVISEAQIFFSVARGHFLFEFGQFLKPVTVDSLNYSELLKSNFYSFLVRKLTSNGCSNALNYLHGQIYFTIVPQKFRFCLFRFDTGILLEVYGYVIVLPDSSIYWIVDYYELLLCIQWNVAVRLRFVQLDDMLKVYEQLLPFTKLPLQTELLYQQGIQRFVHNRVALLSFISLLKYACESETPFTTRKIFAEIFTNISQPLSDQMDCTRDYNSPGFANKISQSSLLSMFSLNVPIFYIVNTKQTIFILGVNYCLRLLIQYNEITYQIYRKPKRIFRIVTMLLQTLRPLVCNFLISLMHNRAEKLFITQLIITQSTISELQSEQYLQESCTENLYLLNCLTLTLPLINIDSLNLQRYHQYLGSIQSYHLHLISSKLSNQGMTISEKR
ncbi:Hypothetical_protein [Hexamita inflata]|uniref:Hypothetical_protein n=1 Tax=Hexamita inflata TaxID=28002 RepID=A0AA86RTG9_9EUKA|nr:Hypothetical protein HINF_LOCUS65289 [Hexamita inflata]